jgi:hypothetical protein
MPRLSAAEVVANQKAHQHYCAVRAMHRVAASDDALAARLGWLQADIRQGGQEKQETPSAATDEVSTTPSAWTDRRAASAHVARGR